MAFCTSCGAQLADGAKFCGSCGASQGAGASYTSQPMKRMDEGSVIGGIGIGSFFGKQ